MRAGKFYIMKRDNHTKPSFRHRMLAAAVVFGGLIGPGIAAENLVILHTNDTHSQIDPIESSGLGGVLRRKAAIDSVRAAEKNVLLVDAGDAVQGSLFFYLYGGEVEARLMNEMKVDMGILGNHEFDNGMDALAKMMALREDELLATNYFLENSTLKGMFKPYSVRTVGDKRLGFIGVNLQPEGMISDGNAEGVVYSDAIKTADLTAKFLKDVEKVDAVIALTHIGYNPETPPGDSLLARESEYIDVIIGGHSHTVINPADATGKRRSEAVNDEGQPVLIAQTGKSGAYMGKITINLDSIGQGRHVRPDYELIKIDSRFDGKEDPEMLAIINEYRPGVDSLMRIPVGHARRDIDHEGIRELNYMSDFLYKRGTEMTDLPLDFAIINKGGLRIDIPKGVISKGQIINLLPFQNKILIEEVKGRDLRDVFDAMSRTGGNGVSSQVYAEYDPEELKATKILINGKPLDDERTYRIATIDYLAKGGDYLTGLREGTIIQEGDKWLYDEMIDWLTTGSGKGKAFGEGSPKPRMIAKKK